MISNIDLVIFLILIEQINNWVLKWKAIFLMNWD